MIERQPQPQVLVPYSQVPDLAKQLHKCAASNANELNARGLYGVMRQYGNTERAEQSVRRAWDDVELDRFAVMGADGNVKGAASLYPHVPFRKLHLPLPPAVVGRVLASKYPSTPTPHVQAWTCDKGEETNLLRDAYAELVEKAKKASNEDIVSMPWTVEPVHSPYAVRRAIELSGLEKVATGWFDGVESRWRMPPRAILYVVQPKKAVHLPNRHLSGPKEGSN